MDLHVVSNTSFFRKSQSSTRVVDTVNQQETPELVHAARVIQRWWKQTNLKLTAKESSRYIKYVVSLRKAESKSFSALEAYVLDKNTLASTRKILMHIEQAKDLILPHRTRGKDVLRAERIFLSAYLIATKSDHVFESPDDIDELLLAHANDMLTSFENLCKFMGETYMEKIPNQPHSPMKKNTPSSDQIFANMARYELDQSRENMEKDRRFMTEGRVFLEAFHKTQLAYYDVFSQWESNNRFKLVNICIDQCLRLESKRFAAFTSPDPTAIEMYEGLGHQQEALREKIGDLVGEEGLRRLDQDLQGLRAALEASKWVTASEEVLLHELALNPEFKVSAEECVISPQCDINAAILAVTKTSPDFEPMLDVLEEIRDQLAMFTPNNDRRITALQTEYSRQVLTEQIDSLGLEKGLFRIIFSFIEKIKEREAPAHDSETRRFEYGLDRKIDDMDDFGVALQQAIDFIYQKFSEINLEKSNFHINEARTLVNDDIIKFEQHNFQARLVPRQLKDAPQFNLKDTPQFNLKHILHWIDDIVKSPTSYRLEPGILYSQYIPTHITHAIVIGLLQKPGQFDLLAVPETFYLDRARLEAWHGRYQQIFSAITARFKGDRRVEELFHKRLAEPLMIYFNKGLFPELSRGQTDLLYGARKDLEQLGREMRPLVLLHAKVHEAFYNSSVHARLWKPLFAILSSASEPADFPSEFLSNQESILAIRATIHRLAFLLTGLSLIQQKVIFSEFMVADTTVMKNSAIKTLASSFGLPNHDASNDEIEEKLLALMKHVAREQAVAYGDSDEQEMKGMLGLVKDGTSPGYKSFLHALSEIYKPFITKGSMPVLNPNLLTAEYRDEIEHICERIKNITIAIIQPRLPEDVNPVVQTVPMPRAGISR